jgi:hypothetical protein
LCIDRTILKNLLQSFLFKFEIHNQTSSIQIVFILISIHSIIRVITVRFTFIRIHTPFHLFLTFLQILHPRLSHFTIPHSRSFNHPSRSTVLHNFPIPTISLTSSSPCSTTSLIILILPFTLFKFRIINFLPSCPSIIHRRRSLPHGQS